MKQWHPIFVQLLRPAVEAHYDVLTTVPVGDAPREADIVLLRRTAATAPPFRGLWKNLTTWNVLEFKGPTVSPRLRDLDALVELGLGIDRRLNEERVRQDLRPLPPSEVSFWFLTKRLGRRLLRDAQKHLGTLEQTSDGIWRCELLQRLVFLVSSVNLVVEKDSVPLHLITKEPQDMNREAALLIAAKPELWDRYSSWLRILHPKYWEEVQDMAKATNKKLEINWKPFLRAMEEDKSGELRELFLQTLPVDDMIRIIGRKRFLERMGQEERQAFKRLLN